MYSTYEGGEVGNSTRTYLILTPLRLYLFPDEVYLYLNLVYLFLAYRTRYLSILLPCRLLFLQVYGTLF